MYLNKQLDNKFTINAQNRLIIYSFLFNV